MKRCVPTIFLAQGVTTARHTQLLRRIISWAAFASALLVYCITLEHGASYWDCPEYIVTAWRLEVGHPPGNPLWTLTARIFTILGGAPHNAAIAVNISSALFMAGGTALLASTIFFCLRFSLMRARSLTSLRLTALFSFSAAMCFGWADSPWFSAVEAEVYAMSLFLTALSVRLMIGWAIMPRRSATRRHLLLIVYLTGLSIGVHQLNLLVIPVLVLIWYFRRHPRRSAKGTALWLFLSFFFVAAILLGLMPGVLWVAEKCEWICVNSFGLPYNSGVIFAMALMTILALLCPILLRRTRLQTWGWIPPLLLTGYSVFFILLIRGAANPPMNEAAPSDIFALSSYLNRDQYGAAPLFYGRTPYSQPLRLEAIDSTGRASYNRFATRKRKDRIAKRTLPDGNKGYVKYGERIEYRYPPELNMFLPRLISGNPDDIAAYGDWAGMTTESMTTVEVSYALDSTGRPVGRLLEDGTRVKEKALRPTYLHQLRYLGGYQIGYMYLRYLLWNFCGRQNDRFAVGEVEHGNFITGITPIDNAMLGPSDEMPPEIGNQNPGRNVYFMVPLILGILGILALCGNKGDTRKRYSRLNFIIFILFFMTGVAIVLYINQSPREPRERDYSFLGSLWAYTIWIGIGMAWLWLTSRRIRHARLRRIAGIGVIALSLATPIWMLCQNYDDHDRSGRTAVEAYAANLLNSLEPDAILFVNGDNFTFPLWYMQEVHGLRRDITIINTAYLTTPWYALQMMRQGEQSLPVSMQCSPEDIAYGDFANVYFSHPSYSDTLNAKDCIGALRDMYAKKVKYPRLPAVMAIRTGAGDSILIAAESIAAGKGRIDAAALMTLDIIASNADQASPRPVYWHDMLPSSSYIGLQGYTVRDLQTRRLNILADTLSPAPPEKKLKMESGGADRPGFYADVTTGGMISRQRMSMVRYAGRLLADGYPREALDLALESERLFPAQVWEYQILYDADSIHHEGFELAELKMRAGRLLGDTAALNEGQRLYDREQKRYDQWRRYRNSLPPRLRNLLTPKNLRKARHTP